jgi:hypothetical protein
MKIVYVPLAHFNPNSGGNSVLKEQAITLLENNFKVFIYYDNDAVFNSLHPIFKDIPSIGHDCYTDNEEKIFVVSEEFIWYVDSHLIPNNKKYIMFNQGINATFISGMSFNDTKKIYIKSDGIIVNSEHTRYGIQRLFNPLPNKVHLQRIGIDNELFFPREKTIDITYLTNKNYLFVNFIDKYLADKYPQLIINRLDGCTREEFADVLSRTKLFLSFGGPEGFGMPPLEAVFSKCKVLGFHGDGGKEFFTPPLLKNIEFFSYYDFLDSLDKAIIDLNRWDTTLEDQYKNLLTMYSKKKSEDSTIQIFTNILDQL